MIHPSTLLPLLLLLSGALLPAPALAAQARLQAERIEGAGWWAKRVDLVLEVDAQARPGLRMKAATARLPGGLGEVTALEIRCARLQTAPGRWTCPRAQLRGRFHDWGAQDFTASIDFRAPTAPGRAPGLKVEAAGLELGGGELSVAIESHAEDWRARGRLAGADLAVLQRVTAPWVTWPEGQWSGLASAEGIAVGHGITLQSVNATVELPTLGFLGPDGLTATEALAGTLAIDWSSRGTGIRSDTDHVPALRFRYAATRGQFYLDPVFVDAGAHPFVLEGSAPWPHGAESPGEMTWAFRQPGVVDARGTAQLNLGPGALLERLEAELANVEIAKAWPLYVAPYLAATDFKDLQASGDVEGRLVIRQGLPDAADLRVQGFALASPDGSIDWHGLAGQLRWTADDSPTDADAGTTALSWEGGRFYGLPFGATSMRLQLGGKSARLLEPLTLPILDGGLRIDTLRVRHAGEPRMWLRLDAELLPIDMAQLSRAFGWPAFGGKVAGRIPKAALEDGVLTLGGNLEAEVFGGRVTLGNLTLQEPLGRFPQLQADIRLADLDLALLTGVFEFGYISGRLSGEVKDLQLFDWRPVAFDARLATPDDYRGLRRITPRAVQNLSNLGGGSGVTSALSSGFLRFFKDFGYRRLGIACRLERDVCRMGGVAPAPGGYYLIQGAGFPRINLIGSQGRVGWSKLLRQLERLGDGAPLEVR